MLSSELCDDECWNKTVNRQPLRFTVYQLAQGSINKIVKERKKFSPSNGAFTVDTSHSFVK